MTISRFARRVALLMGATPFTTVLAHPGHQHNSTFIERVLHALQTEWGPVLLLAVISIGGIALVKRRRSEKPDR